MIKPQCFLPLLFCWVVPCFAWFTPQAIYKNLYIFILVASNLHHQLCLVKTLYAGKKPGFPGFPVSSTLKPRVRLLKHQLQTFPALSNAQALHIAAGKLQLTRDSNWETLGSYHWTIDFRLEANDTTLHEGDFRTGQPFLRHLLARNGKRPRSAVPLPRRTG